MSEAPMTGKVREAGDSAWVRLRLACRTRMAQIRAVGVQKRYNRCALGPNERFSIAHRAFGERADF